MIFSHAFSRAWHGRHVFASSSDWFIGLFTTVVIGQSNYFGFGFTTQLKTALCSHFFMSLYSRWIFYKRFDYSLPGQHHENCAHLLSRDFFLFKDSKQCAMTLCGRKKKITWRSSSITACLVTICLTVSCGPWREYRWLYKNITAYKKCSLVATMTGNSDKQQHRKVVLVCSFHLKDQAFNTYVQDCMQELFNKYFRFDKLISHFHITNFVCDKWHFLYNTQMRFTTLFGGLCQTANAVYN